MTDFIQGKTYNNFTLIDTQNIAEIRSTVYQFQHQSLGCTALAIKNNDPNKTFCVSFMTVPEDSTGVAHILEHSVLMGSEKYPVHDVFGEINKGGLMTFLNAMTGADTTWYPFATRNLREYFNIMDVYCDVTFFPLLDQTTFEQEGWHFHLENPEDRIEYSGVVFNEMKGAFSDPIRALFHQTYKGLLPGSTYAHESGGDPAHIPDLSYEQFVRFHRDHYHPSNATFFFYGNAPLDQELAFLDQQVLCRFSTPVPKATIEPGQPAKDMVFKETGYPVQPDGDLGQKTFHAVSSIVGTATERKKNTAFQIIAHILFNSDASPLKKAIIEAGLCRDFGGLFLGNSTYIGIMMTYLIGSDQDKRDTFLELYRSTLARMVTNSLDRELVLSELNKYEFSVREEMNKAQRGLDLVGKVLPAMKYDLDPFTALQTEALLAEIRHDALNNRYFEHLIQQHLLDNPSTVVVTLFPDPEKLQQNTRREQERLEAHARQLDEEQRLALATRTRELIERQSTPNPASSLRLLPRLTVDDLDPAPRMHAVTPSQLAGAELLINDLPTNGICYLDFGFDCSTLAAELLGYLDIFGTILTEIGTSTKDYIQFTKDINLYTGGFSHSFNTYLQFGSRDYVRPVQWLHLKTLSSNLEKALSLLHEVLTDVNLENRQRIREIVQREYAWAEHSIQSEGYTLASTRVFAGLSQAGKYNEYINGSHAYLQLRQLALHYEEEEERFLQALTVIKDRLLRRDGFTLCVTADQADIAQFQQLAPALVHALPTQLPSAAPPVFDRLATSHAFHTSAEVVYNVQGCTLFPDPTQYEGGFEVLKTWISRDYLWNTVRQKGGAYGCFIQFNHLTGNFGVVSYRDPQIDKTYAAYDALEETVEKLEISDDMLSQLIIGTYGNLTPHQGPAAKGATARNEYLSGVTPEFKRQRIEQVIRTKTATLRGYAPLFSRFREQAMRATIGNGEKISNAQTTFDQTIIL